MAELRTKTSLSTSQQVNSELIPSHDFSMKLAMEKLSDDEMDALLAVDGMPAVATKSESLASLVQKLLKEKEELQEKFQSSKIARAACLPRNQTIDPKYRKLRR